MAEMENEYKKYLKLLLGLFGIVLLPIIFITVDGIINPQPSFREICESNGGTFIENHGRVGNSCVYNKEQK